jgi:uncharacterized cupin superfamily protein
MSRLLRRGMNYQVTCSSYTRASAVPGVMILGIALRPSKDSRVQIIRYNDMSTCSEDARSDDGRFNFGHIQASDGMFRTTTYERECCEIINAC